MIVDHSSPDWRATKIADSPSLDGHDHRAMSDAACRERRLQRVLLLMGCDRLERHSSAGFCGGDKDGMSSKGPWRLHAKGGRPAVSNDVR